MADTKDFVHLQLPNPVSNPAAFRRPMIPPQTQTAQNQQNRQFHGSNLKKRATDLSTMWNARRNERQQQNLPTIEGGIPFLLQIDPATDISFIYGLGFEVVCDLDDGFIVVATNDADLNKFQQKVDDFISNKQRSGSPAKVYGLCDDEDRLSRILSKSLYEKWAMLDAFTNYIVDLSIECNGLTRNPDLPEKNDRESEFDYDARCKEAQNKYYEAIDKIARERQQQFENIVTAYNVDQGFEYIDDVDSFSVRITINGNGLRDLVRNFGYIFEVETVLSEAISDYFINEFPSDIDELSTHSGIESIEVESIDKMELFEDGTIHASGKGTIECNLQQGSNSDVRNDIGVVWEDSFPFDFTVILDAEYDTEKPYNDRFSISQLQYSIDTSGYYEGH